MRIPGSQARSFEDRSCEVHCRCGGLLTTLRPGERVALKGPSAVPARSFTCQGCGSVTQIQVEGSDG